MAEPLHNHAREELQDKGSSVTSSTADEASITTKPASRNLQETTKDASVEVAIPILSLYCCHACGVVSTISIAYHPFRS